jgi:hypothetical protein
MIDKLMQSDAKICKVYTHSWQVLDESQKFYRLLQLLGEWHEHGADLCGLGKPASRQALACGANQNDTK